MSYALSQIKRIDNETYRFACVAREKVRHVEEKWCDWMSLMSSLANSVAFSNKIIYKNCFFKAFGRVISGGKECLVRSRRSKQESGGFSNQNPN